MATIATTVSAVLVMIFILLCLPERGIFKFHPSTMTISYLGCMFQAIYVFSMDDASTTTTRRKQIFIHSSLQIVAIVSAIVGFGSIYLNKEQRGKPHFQTWHSWFGLLVFVWSLIQAFAGLFLTILQRFIRSFGLTYVQLRMYHATSGALLFTFSCFATVLGLVSNWFKSKMPENTTLYWIIVYFLTSSILYLAHKTVDQVKTRYVTNRISKK